jgi:hypothetical protein
VALRIDLLEDSHLGSSAGCLLGRVLVWSENPDAEGEKRERIDLDLTIFEIHLPANLEVQSVRRTAPANPLYAGLVHSKIGTAPLCSSVIAVLPPVPPVARASLSALVTILAIDGAIAAGFKRHCGLLSAIGTRDGSSLNGVSLVLAGCTLFVLL